MGVLGGAQTASAALGGAPMSTPSGASVNTTSGPGAASSVARQATQSTPSGISSASSAGTSTAYTVRETTLANGTAVREYLTTAGTVFAVAWSGPQMPDLSALLGSYFPQYVAGVQASRAKGVRGPGAVENSGLVVHSGGHMGAFSGQAWLPQALPAGFSTSDIQ
ncbi:uncharacterized protein DUF2844 [Paraburkholderia eburnea]|uniref:Uncharacterized protein DUF2844 n=1 Tax=Paraburkholderia eburnea TaxID=1189126 RepID=A0A2S4M545_9BURK|nr:DUF2844 domain-containing protein [Paraburkholderia eburnea]POR49828.1 uncharacterized protein DUF2844 [Paraburkholderia eburnea]PRZ20256.1 uncharacterized protein DUF2844 [Paraburkholderia eburnea]